jgi:hypothetical protein
MRISVQKVGKILHALTVDIMRISARVMMMMPLLLLLLTLLLATATLL